MVGLAAVATLVVAGLASFFMAWTIGAGSSGSTPFAPAVGANAISIMRAGFVVGILGFIGAVTQGANVSAAVGTELVVGVTLSPVAAIAGLVLAAALVAVGIFAGYPIATAFTVTGAIVGVGVGAGGAPNWPKFQQIALLWVATPFVGGGAAYLTVRWLRAGGVAERRAVPALGAVVGAILANIAFSLLAPAGESASVAGVVATALPAAPLATRVAVTLAFAGTAALVLARGLDRSPEATKQRFLLVIGGLVAFSAGGSQVGLAVGPLLPVLDPSPLPLVVPVGAVLAFGGIGLLVGSWTGAPRMIKALSQDYSSLGPGRSTAALVPAFAIAQIAVLFGIPVSFNEIIVSTIVGAGYAGAGGGAGGVSAEKMGKTALAWIGSLALAAGAGFAVMAAVEALA